MYIYIKTYFAHHLLPDAPASRLIFNARRCSRYPLAVSFASLYTGHTRVWPHGYWINNMYIVWLRSGFANMHGRVLYYVSRMLLGLHIYSIYMTLLHILVWWCICRTMKQFVACFISGRSSSYHLGRSFNSRMRWCKVFRQWLWENCNSNTEQKN